MSISFQKDGAPMYLPPYVKTCIDTLEQAGFAAYAVGGCVRDALLGLTPHDYDLCTNAAPGQIREVFSGYALVLAGEKHGTVGVVTAGGVVEITTFRTEGDYSDGRHPGWVQFVSEIEADLSRRDFTVNAMAYSPCRGFADPFGGRADLEAHRLRAVGDPMVRFREDALRILRGLRFSVRYGLAIEPATWEAMRSLSPQMEQLARERIFDELCKLILLATPEDILRFAPILEVVIPELKPLAGFDQHSPYHAFDLLTHTAYVTGAMPPVLHLRWAALLHDIGKPQTFFLDGDGRGHFPDHAKVGAELANRVLLMLKAPTALRQQVADLIARHMTPLEPEKKLLRRRMGKYGVEATFDLLTLQRADFGSKGTKEETDWFDRTEALLRELLEEDTCLTVRDLAVNGRDMISLGLAGRQIGLCLNMLLALVQEESIPNAKDALLDVARKWKEVQL